jgi:hypothetical protein
MKLRSRRAAALALLLALAAAPLASAAAEVRAERRARPPKPARKVKEPKQSKQPKPEEDAAAQEFAKIAVPRIPGLDQSPSVPPYGRCTDALDAHIRPTSNWCQFGRMGTCERARGGGEGAGVRRGARGAAGPLGAASVGRLRQQQLRSLTDGRRRPNCQGRPGPSARPSSTSSLGG